MNILLQLWLRMLSLLRRGKYEREMEEEMRFHLEMQMVGKRLKLAVAHSRLHAPVRPSSAEQGCSL
jgi:hypothetical protein